jgi:hypothetical protein
MYNFNFSKKYFKDIKFNKFNRKETVHLIPGTASFGSAGIYS